MLEEIECEVCAENERRLAETGGSSALVDKLWRYCKLLRDDGVQVGDYVEQLTYLLFLKMAHEYSTNPLRQLEIVPSEYSWQRLLDADGRDLELIYESMLDGLSRERGVLGVVFRKAKNKIKNAARLKRLINELIGVENWSATGVDIKGDAYESLLAKSSAEAKKAAGQFFTPRPLISAIVDCMSITPSDSVHDPACGSGGFLISAVEHASHADNLSPDERKWLQEGFASGVDNSEGPARIATMNMILHGVIQPTGEATIIERDSLTADPGTRYSVVLANPPFGTQSGEELEIVRDDFWVTVANKQMNFIQHIKTILDVEGRAAVVLPDNVLFEIGGGETIRQRLLREFDLHTMLRLPTGIFYAGGVKANVLFFDKKPASSSPWTKELWVYDFRSNKHFTQKTKPMRRVDLEEFVQAYRPGARNQRVESERFKKFSYDDLVGRENTNLDILWLKDDSVIDAADLPAPDVLAEEILESLQSAVSDIQDLLDQLRGRP